MAGGLKSLARAAAKLGKARRRGKRLPSLLIFSDPVRLPNLEAVASRGPRGIGLVLRTFGDPALEAQAASLAKLARHRGQLLLIGADERLAAMVGAAGIHLPERMASRARAIRARRPGWIITIAAHSPASAHYAARMGADAVVISTIFPSLSPSSGKPMGPHRLAALVRALKAPVYGLGGVDARTLKALRRTGVAGAALVGAARS